MKIIKKLLYIFGGLFALLCAFVLVCAFNPALSEKVASALYPERGAGGDNRPPDNGGAGEQEGPGVSSGDGVADVPGGEDGPKEEQPDVSYPYPGQDTYVPPEREEQAIPERVRGRNGYVPLTEEREAAGAEGNAGPGETGEGLSFDPEIYPYYGMLGDTLREFYRQVYANALALNPVFSPLAGVSASQAMTVMEAVYNDHPELFFMDTAYSCKVAEDGRCVEIAMRFNRTADNIETARENFTKKANEIISGALRYTSDYEKERYIHDALLGRVTYNLSAPMNQSAYSALSGGQTVCAGYARAFQYLLQQLGIPCYYCTGYAGGNHAWNIVRLDGEYYNTDVTWDDASADSRAYFNRTDADFSATHERRGLSVYLPACNGEEYRNLKWEPPKEEEPEPDEKPGDKPDGPVVSGPDAGYSGAVLKSLKDYYDNCYAQLSKGGGGTVIFQNVVTPRVLEELYAAYGKEDYTKGYMDKFLKESGVKRYTINIGINPYGDGNYLLSHTVVLY